MTPSRAAPAIHQFVATAEPGAVGAHMLEVQRLIREVLLRPSEIFAEHLRGPFLERGRHFKDYGCAVPANPGDVVVYHLAIGSVVADW
ncbi:MAG: hypothetical protein M3137_01685, partial [Actinomycetota bacterium]|nr:hypothetical protein [Actinomycetota bacterium]